MQVGSCTVRLDQEGSPTKVASYNCPARYGVAALKKDMERLAKDGVMVIATQENGDDQPKQMCPDGWGWYRPKKGQSSAILYSKKLKIINKNIVKISSKGDPVAPRYLPSIKVEAPNGQVKTIASAHLPAFIRDNKKNRKEHGKQLDKCAEWITKNEQRIILGDFNADPDSKYMKRLREVAKYHTGHLKSGPSGQEIDHAWVNKKKKNRAEGKKIMRGASDHAAAIFVV